MPAVGAVRHNADPVGEWRGQEYTTRRDQGRDDERGNGSGQAASAWASEVPTQSSTVSRCCAAAASRLHHRRVSRNTVTGDGEILAEAAADGRLTITTLPPTAFCTMRAVADLHRPVAAEIDRQAAGAAAVAMLIRPAGIVDMEEHAAARHHNG
jgi:hypothetical protein